MHPPASFLAFAQVVLVAAVVFLAVEVKAADNRASSSHEARYKRMMRAGFALYRSGRKDDGIEMVEEALRIKVDDKVMLLIRDEMDWKTLELMMMEGVGRNPRPWWNK